MSALTKMLENMIDYNCKVISHDEFMYKNGTIYIATNEVYMDNLDWKAFLKREYGFDLTRKNWFVMSVLHELGHHFTLDAFTVEETAKSQRECEDPVEHYIEPVERAATEWAIEYYNTHGMDVWNKEVMAML